MDYPTVVQEFSSYGLLESSLVTYPQIQQVMNKLVSRNSHQMTAIFKQDVGREIWDQCSKDQNEMVVLGEYAQVLIEAKDILEERVRETSQKIHNLKTQRQKLERELISLRASRNQTEKDNLRTELQSIQRDINDAEQDKNNYNQDYLAITIPFIDDGSISRQNITGNKSFLHVNDSYNSPNVANPSMGSLSQVFMKRSSQALTMIFYLAVLGLFLELFIMFHKPHFVSLIAILAVLAIFGLNYFDRAYIKITLGLVFISVVMDLLWLLFYVGQYANPNQFNQNSSIHTGWLRFTLFLVFVNGVVKSIVFLILMSYRNVQQVSTISLFGYSISLSGQCLPLSNWNVIR